MVSTNENDSLSRQRVFLPLLTCVPLVTMSRHHDDDVNDSMFAVTIVASTHRLLSMRYEYLRLVLQRVMESVTAMGNIVN